MIVKRHWAELGRLIYVREIPNFMERCNTNLMLRILLDPGCAVDIPGFCYSYSFAPKPDFTQMFPSQAEILQYLLEVAKEYSVDRHFKGGMEWTAADWQEKSQIWVVTLKDIQTKQVFKQECQVLISAVGGLVNPQEISIPGAERFRGEMIHTARWKKGLDLTKKHVGVIGNGGKQLLGGFGMILLGSRMTRDSIRYASRASYHQGNEIGHTVHAGQCSTIIIFAGA